MEKKHIKINEFHHPDLPRAGASLKEVITELTKITGKEKVKISLEGETPERSVFDEIDADTSGDLKVMVYGSELATLRLWDHYPHTGYGVKQGFSKEKNSWFYSGKLY